MEKEIDTAKYKQINGEIWRNDVFQELSPEDRDLYFFLWSNYKTSFLGICKYTGYFKTETNRSEESIIKSLKSLEKNGFVYIYTKEIDGEVKIKRIVMKGVVDFHHSGFNPSWQQKEYEKLSEMCEEDPEFEEFLKKKDISYEKFLGDGKITHTIKKESKTLKSAKEYIDNNPQINAQIEDIDAMFMEINGHKSEARLPQIKVIMAQVLTGRTFEQVRKTAREYVDWCLGKNGECDVLRKRNLSQDVFHFLYNFAFIMNALNVTNNNEYQAPVSEASQKNMDASLEAFFKDK
jgi:hypothetical protein